jgi:hypothetical protein
MKGREDCGGRGLVPFLQKDLHINSCPQVNVQTLYPIPFEHWTRFNTRICHISSAFQYGHDETFLGKIKHTYVPQQLLHVNLCDES